MQYEIKVVEEWFDFYGKFRWTNEQVIQKFEQLSAIFNFKKHLNNSEKTPEAIMLSILQKAKDADKGLFALGD